MVKLFVLAIGIAAGYTFGFRDGHAGRAHVATRAVESVRKTFNAQSGTNVDSIMSRLEGKK